MNGGRVSHSWGMCVVVMAMVCWVGAGMGLVNGMHSVQRQGLIACLEMLEHFQNAK